MNAWPKRSRASICSPGADKDSGVWRVTVLTRMVLAWRMVLVARVLRQHQVLQAVQEAQAAALLSRL